MDELSSEFIEVNRSRAKAVKERLARMGLSVSLGQAYEVVATAHGHRNWPIMKSAAPVTAPEISSLPKPVGSVMELERIVSGFKDFIELRQKHFVPKNKMLVLGGRGSDRRGFVENLAKDLNLKVGEILVEVTASEMDNAFSFAYRQGLLLFIDRVERMDVTSGGAGERLAKYLDEMPPGQFIVLGSDKSDSIIDLALLRRVHYRHCLD